MDIEKLSQAITDYGDARQVNNLRLIAFSIGVINSILTHSTKAQSLSPDDHQDEEIKVK